MNQLDVRILKGEIRTRKLSLSAMEGRTHFDGRKFQLRRKLSLGETRQDGEDLLQLEKGCSRLGHAA
jgi:hypothetical protein